MPPDQVVAGVALEAGAASILRGWPLATASKSWRWRAGLGRPGDWSTVAIADWYGPERGPTRY